MPFGALNRRCALRPARCSGEEPFDGRMCICVGRSGRPAHVREKEVKACTVFHVGQRMPGGEQVRISIGESPLLIGEDLTKPKLR